MPVDVSNFITPEETYGGLYKIGDEYRQDQRYKLAQQLAQQKEAEQEKARMNTASTYFQNYLNPRHFKTNTALDQYITSGLNGALKQAMSLISQGADTASVTNAIAPAVEDVSRAYDNINALQQQKNQHLSFLKSGAGVGIDPNKYAEMFDKTAYYNPDGSIKKLSDIDPTQNIDEQILSNPSVYNNDSLMKWANQQAINAPSQKSKRTVIGSNGRKVMTSGSLKMPLFAQQEINPDGTFSTYVPKYNEATDEDAPLFHQFNKENGAKENAPVRMVTDDVFNSLPQTYLQKLKAEVGSYLKANPNLNLDLNSPQAESLAKALAYNDLKPLATARSNYSVITEKQDAPLHSASWYGKSSSGGNGGAIDLYTPLKNIVDAHANRAINDAITNKDIVGAVPLNMLDDNTQSAIMENVKSVFPKVSQSNIYIAKDNNGNIVVRRYSTDPEQNNKGVLTITPSGLNMAANKSLGVKAKQAAVSNSGNEVKPKTKTENGLPIF